MIILKFGGTSVGSANRMKNVVRLISNDEKNIFVLFAMSGTTNLLFEIAENLYKKGLNKKFYFLFNPVIL